jgi:hypothetical protein
MVNQEDFSNGRFIFYLQKFNMGDLKSKIAGKNHEINR